MQVEDDGAGIARDELPLALARHATSKIASLEDLEGVATMGFRGEALASIASVSRLSIASRTRDAAHARGDLAPKARSSARSSPRRARRAPRSTVADLYFNTPARRKFLRTEATEFGHCDEVFRAHRAGALRHRLHRSSTTAASARCCARSRRAERVAALLGEAFSSASLPVERQAGALRLFGLRRHAAGGRARAPTRSTSSSTAATCATGCCRTRCARPTRELLHGERQPAYVLFLEIDPRARRRQRAPGEDRGALPRLARRAPVRVPRAAARARRRARPRRRSAMRPFSGQQARFQAALRAGATGGRLRVVRSSVRAQLARRAAEKAPPLGYALAPAARRLHPGAERGRPGAGRHARRARAHRDGEAEEQPRRRRGAAPEPAGAGGVLAPRRSTSPPRRRTARRSSGSASSSRSPARTSSRCARRPRRSPAATSPALARDVLREIREYGASQVLVVAAERAARHHGLPRRGARQPRAQRCPR